MQSLKVELINVLVGLSSEELRMIAIKLAARKPELFISLAKDSDYTMLVLDTIAATKFKKPSCSGKIEAIRAVRAKSHEDLSTALNLHEAKLIVESVLDSLENPTPFQHTMLD